ncbi:MAG: 3-dehydroquinate synthase [Acholeplasmataceae bacterium]|nr:3-dehydroquinate synthase [Acholeplasmataceae bacterium]
MFIKMPDYEIWVKEGIFSEIHQMIKTVKGNPSIFVVTDENVYALYEKLIKTTLASYSIDFVVIKPGETSKSIDTYLEVVKSLIHKKIKRDDLIISFGGGVVGDLSGFVAATLYRGIDYIQVPTTLLAQTDSSIGSKVAIDLEEGKNLIGSFYSPKGVIIDPLFLNTLPKEEYVNGLAEVLKAGLIGNKKLYHHFLTEDKLNENEIIDAILVKRDIVLLDPNEQKERMFLNFGHTFGHAIEKAYHYQTFKHGEAISYGMLFALELGIKWHKTDVNLYEEVKKILIHLNLVKEPLLKYEDFIDYIWNDKKNRHDGLRFITISKPGHPEIHVVNEGDFK